MGGIARNCLPTPYLFVSKYLCADFHSISLLVLFQMKIVFSFLFLFCSLKMVGKLGL